MDDRRERVPQEKKRNLGSLNRWKCIDFYGPFCLLGGWAVPLPTGLGDGRWAVPLPTGLGDGRWKVPLPTGLVLNVVFLSPSNKLNGFKLFLIFLELCWSVYTY